MCDAKPLTIDECKVGMKVRGITPKNADDEIAKLLAGEWVITDIRKLGCDSTISVKNGHKEEGGWYPYRFTKVCDCASKLAPKESKAEMSLEDIDTIIKGVSRHFKARGTVTVATAVNFTREMIRKSGGAFIDQTEGHYTVFVLPNGVAGVAKCNPKDKYDKNLGMRLALTRAVYNFFEDVLDKVPESEIRNKAIDRQIADLQKKIARLESEKK